MKAGRSIIRPQRLSNTTAATPLTYRIPTEATRATRQCDRNPFIRYLAKKLALGYNSLKGELFIATNQDLSLAEVVGFVTSIYLSLIQWDRPQVTRELKKNKGKCYDAI
jgi:hypothetical protein